MPETAKKKLTISKDKAFSLLNSMLNIRIFEETALKAYQQRKIAGFFHSYIGQEAVGVGVLDNREPQDSAVTSYRCHGIGLALGLDPKSGMAELFGKVTGCARGKGGSMHFFDKENHFLGGHGIVGGQFGVGIGAAFKSKYEEDNGVSYIFFGDGAIVQGTFNETMNLAALWDLPAIFICEDNQYGMGTSSKRAISNTQLADKAVGFGIKGYTIDGMDVIEVQKQMKKIVEEVRKTKRPVLVHMKTYRYFGHSVSDAGLYRTKDEVKEYRQRDPIMTLKQNMEEAGLIDDDEFKTLQKEYRSTMQEAVSFAESSPEPPLEELTKHVYFDEPEL